MPLKNIRFNLEDPDDQKLYEWLKRQPHGEFSEKTKQFWMEQMNKEEENNV